jgi:NAD(P)-dependent dehydrogenase (short-subunit alcohol dehydrogenase family)
MSKADSLKAVCITGAVNRLGFVLAKRALQRGYAVIAHYRSSRGELDHWLESRPAYRSRVHFIQQDLADHPEMLIDHARECSSSIVGLVNNASEFTRGNLYDKDHFERMLMINALAPASVARRFAQTIECGWIVNMTDAHIDPLNRAYQNYRVAKLLLSELTRQLAYLFAPSIRVNAIAPGAMLPAAHQRKDSFLKLSSAIPLAKTGDLAALVRAFDYCVDNEYVTGQTLYIDGGWHMMP